jgi:hypothetical protein
VVGLFGYKKVANTFMCFEGQNNKKKNTLFALSWQTGQK